jgi:hypothetical protein
MDKQFSSVTDDLADRTLRYSKDEFDRVLQQTSDYVREKPVQSIGYALLAGFILNRLPIGRILSGMIRLLTIAFKPAILIYGATKLYRASQDQN